ncbi:Ig-like domain-containing protein [Marinoscillum sp. MHG1-6]|uniref:Ig-like domain-containing protein n=1 Tax=Marinoscillum sp. MHG1-6 TaxID=2959627 RepID=UPI0021574FF3|nr:Ig-like domain-containing protein [Marinoscillum sp. MHG1-6]
MKKFIVLLLSILLSEVLLQNCANTRTPTGGPRDTIPPKLLLSIPEDQTINFQGQEITLYFDEFIKADKLTQQLIITPNTDVKYKHIIKKRSITLKFDEPFQDSSTYTFNFFDGITDITENNPAENLIIALSTGNYIDSLRVIGSVKELFTHKPIDKATVGLFKLSDSLDIVAQSPYYFISTDKQGKFELKNLKAGKYRIISFSDENRNLKLDPATESYSFINDTIIPSSQPDSLNLFQIKVNAAPLKFISARPSGLSFDVRYNKPIQDYTTLNKDSSIISLSKLNADKDAISFYNTSEIISDDSTRYIITARDSINNHITDTVYVKFRKSSRKPEAFDYSVKPAKGSVLINNHFNISFNKPVITYDSTFLSLELDTIVSIPLYPLDNKLNSNHTELSFRLPLTHQTYLDTLTKYRNTFHQTDTLNIDSLKLIQYSILNRLSETAFTLKFKPNAFISVQNDSSQELLSSYKYPVPENYGQIKLSLSTSEPSFLVEILNKSGNVYTTKWNCTTCAFQNVPPGEYFIRILIDNNQNGKWEVGNINELIEPEDVIIFSEKSILRANWTLELKYSF